MVFGTALAAGPLVAGTAYGFTCEALCVDASLQPPPARLQHARLRESRPSCSHLTPIVQCSSNNPTDQPQSLLTAPCELITPSSAEAAPCQPPPEQLQTALSAAALRSMKLVHPACCPSPPTSGRALTPRCQRRTQMEIWHSRRGRWWQAAWCLALLLLLARWLRAQRTLSHVRPNLLMPARTHRQHACSTHACVSNAPHVPI